MELFGLKSKGYYKIAGLYFLVEWVDFDSHSVVHVKHVLDGSPEKLERGDVVEVREGLSDKYKATVVASGKLTMNLDTVIITFAASHSATFIILGSQAEMNQLQSQYADSDLSDSGKGAVNLGDLEDSFVPY